MPTNALSQLRGAQCPGVIGRAAAIVLLLGAATSCRVRASYPRVSHARWAGYSGTAWVQGPDASSLQLAHEDIAITSCAVWPTPYEALEETFVRIGHGCTLRGHWSGATLVAETGDSCTLNVGAEEKDLAITDAWVRATQAVSHGITFSYVGRFAYPRTYDIPYRDEEFVEVHIGGELASGAERRHAVYRFEGVLRTSSSADTWCEQQLAPPPPPAPTKPPSPPAPDRAPTWPTSDP